MASLEKAHDESTTESELLELLPNEDWLFKVAIASRADGILLQTLSSDPCWLVRRAVARNVKTPLDALAKLVLDPFPEVAQMVRENPSSPLELREFRLPFLINPNLTPVFEDDTILF